MRIFNRLEEALFVLFSSLQVGLLMIHKITNLIVEEIIK